MSRKVVRQKARQKRSQSQAPGRARAWRWAVAGTVTLGMLGWWTSVRSGTDVRTGTAASAGGTLATSQAAPRDPASLGLPAARTAQAGQRAAIDPATGQLRELEHDEVTETAPGAAVAEPEPEQRIGAGGGIISDVPESLHTFTVARMTADGKVVVEHARGPQGVAAGRPAPSAAAGKSGAKEDHNDR